VTFTPRCKSCGLGGESCRLRFSKSPKPHYVYERRKVGLGLASWCIGVHPAPRKIARPDKDSCPSWRDISGHSADEVRRAMASEADRT